MDKEMKILDFLGQDNIFDFLVRYKKIENEYRMMKKVYEKRVRDELKRIMNGEGIKVQNDVFKVIITESRPIEKLIPKGEMENFSQDIKDLIFKDSMTPSTVRVTLIEEETDEQLT